MLTGKEVQMAKTHSKTPAVDGLQGVAGLVGITVGAIPLLRWAVEREHGAIFRWIFGNPSGAMGYVAPLLVIVATIGFVAALERLKPR